MVRCPHIFNGNSLICGRSQEPWYLRRGHRTRPGVYEDVLCTSPRGQDGGMHPFISRYDVSPLHLHQLDFTKTSNFKGYNAVLSSNNNPDGAGDMHEGFEFGWEVLDDAPGSLDAYHLNDGAMAGANV